MRFPMMRLKQKLTTIVSEVLNKKAYDPVILDIKKLSSLADYFVIVTVDSGRQAKAVVDSLIIKLKQKGEYPFGVEDTGDTWVVVDYNDIIVHIFQKKEREYYNLEKLWIEAKRVQVDNSSVNGVVRE